MKILLICIFHLQTISDDIFIYLHKNQEVHLIGSAVTHPLKILNYEIIMKNCLNKIRFFSLADFFF